VLTTLNDDPFKLDRECDWVIKHKLIEAFRSRHDVGLGSPQVALVDLQYHDIHRERSLFYRMQDKGMVERICRDEAIEKAQDEPPQTTRAKLRGDFIRAAKEKRRDFTVDWVHLKVNDNAQRTVLCKDPFKYSDDRVRKLIESL
jgi:proteasome accessory factor A